VFDVCFLGHVCVDWVVVVNLRRARLVGDCLILFGE
jgi:hypothetical protein